MNPFAFLLICGAGWMNRNQQDVIEYLQEEIRVLWEVLGEKPRLNDGQRRRLATKGKRLGHKALDRFPGLGDPEHLARLAPVVGRPEIRFQLPSQAGTATPQG